METPETRSHNEGFHKDPKGQSSWRPLCMVDSTGKLYERMIFNRMQSELTIRIMKGYRKYNTGSVHCQMATFCLTYSERM